MSDNIALPRKHIDYAAHALEHFNKDAPDPLVSEIVHHLSAALAAPRPEPVVCLVGAHGSAFDLRTTKRAYTYAEQPGGLVASKLGLACAAAASQSAGDSIDRGLALLQELQNQGFGVFALGAEYTAAAAPEPKSKTPAWWMDGLTATLMREGVNKHRAREIAVGYWEAYCQIPGNEEEPT